MLELSSTYFFFSELKEFKLKLDEGAGGIFKCIDCIFHGSTKYYI